MRLVQPPSDRLRAILVQYSQIAFNLPSCMTVFVK